MQTEFESTSDYSARNLHSKQFGHPDEDATPAVQIIEDSYLNAALLRLNGGARVWTYREELHVESL